ncbi:MAG TPA: NUDIX domain-containing protein [Pirellulaceae bacterium]|nr:NUDIX domain-containing protein [Pirellulaceae bacterium]
MPEERGFQIQSCGVLVFRDQPELSFLLMRHANRLDLPKGHIDPDETERQCALRELEEETGIKPEQITLDTDFVFHHEYHVQPRGGGEWMLKRLTVFLGMLKQAQPITPSEHLDFQWIVWSPPHRIQEQTIDPLLDAVDRHWQNHRAV